MNETDYLMTPTEVAKYLGVSKTTMNRYINDPVNPVPTIRLSQMLVRIRKSSFDEWLKNTTPGFLKHK